MLIKVDTNGIVTAIYDDNSSGMYGKIGKPSVKRASHVEPVNGGSIEWAVDMSPVGRPDQQVFSKRSVAIKYEIGVLESMIADGAV